MWLLLLHVSEGLLVKLAEHGLRLSGVSVPHELALPVYEERVRDAGDPETVHQLADGPAFVNREVVLSGLRTHQ